MLKASNKSLERYSRNEKWLTGMKKYFKIYSTIHYRRIQMKKILTAGVALLSIATLAACSGKTASESSKNASKDSSSKVEKSSTSTSKSKSSSKSSKASVDVPEIVLLTDEEIDKAQTIGDMKALYSKLVDNYKKYAKDLGEQIPKSYRSAYTNQVEPALKTLDESKTQFDTALSAGGSDDTVVPEQGRNAFSQQLKSARNTMKQALESAYKMVSPYISSSSDDE